MDTASRGFTTDDITKYCLDDPTHVVLCEMTLPPYHCWNYFWIPYTLLSMLFPTPSIKKESKEDTNA